MCSPPRHHRYVLNGVLNGVLNRFPMIKSIRFIADRLSLIVDLMNFLTPDSSATRHFEVGFSSTNGHSANGDAVCLIE